MYMSRHSPSYPLTAIVAIHMHLAVVQHGKVGVELERMLKRAVALLAGLHFSPLPCTLCVHANLAAGMHRGRASLPRVCMCIFCNCPLGCCNVVKGKVHEMQEHPSLISLRAQNWKGCLQCMGALS